MIGRFEELTRCTSDVQDALISILSEKYISIPELRAATTSSSPSPASTIIATANSRDRGVNDLSSALKRRFNFVRIPVVTNKKSETEIVRFRTEELLRRHRIELDVPPTLLDILLQTFADLRGVGRGGRQRRREAGVGAVHRRADRRARGRDAARPVLRRARADRPRRWPARWSARWSGASPEDVAILNKFCTAWSSRAARNEGGSWPEFLEGGRDAIATLS